MKLFNWLYIYIYVGLEEKEVVRPLTYPNVSESINLETNVYVLKNGRF